MRNKRVSIKRIGASILAMLLIMAVGVGLFSGRTRDVLAAEKTADASTIIKYKDSLGEDTSTEYAGRIWTDKSVWTEDAVEIEAYGGAKYTIKKNENNKTGEDFLVGFSALATAQSVAGETQVPLDVAFIIDLSGSMSNADSNMDNGKSRIFNTVQALNKSIESLMSLNPYTRISVVGFSTDAQVLLPLDHYSKLNNRDYFSLSRQTGSNNYAKLSFCAVGDTVGKIERTSSSDRVSVEGGTNIQRGFYVGMNQLASATSTTVVQNGKEIKRVPSVVFLGDGCPTYSSSSSNWWAPETGTQGSGQGTNKEVRYGNGFKAIMTASWMKAEIDQKYGVKGTNMATKVYTIGMGIDNMDAGNALDLANVSLNPKKHWEDAENAMAQSMKSAWETYTNNNGRPTVTVQGTSTYRVNHPTGNVAISDASFQTDYPIYEYVDSYYPANDASSVNQVFENIVDQIAISAPKIPTEHDPENPTASGYITYTDPIGAYMEVKDFKSIIYGGVQYTAHTVNTEGNVTTYVFTEKAEGNEVYGSEDLNHILIKVTSTKVGETTAKKEILSQVLTVQIPASLIPLRVNAVTVNADGSVSSHTSNGACPIRMLYTVGMQDAVQKDGNLLTNEISEDYLAKYLNEDGTVDFYSNLYTGTNKINEKTAGNATVEFQAASGNAFYYIQSNQYLYTDKDCTQYASTDKLDANTNYYYKTTHYEGVTLVEKVISHKGSQITENTEVTRETTESGSYRWYYSAGMARVNTLLELVEEKETNQTGTATLSYAPTYEKTTESFKVYLGNNGKLNVKAMGALEISKEVTGAEGLDAPDATFTFRVEFEDANGDALSGQYTYVILDQKGNQVSEGVVSNEGTLQLKDGQSARIAHLPAETNYTISEIDIPSGFSVKEAGKETQTGVIYGGRTSSHLFENQYSATPVVYAAETGIVGTKVLEGRQWSVKDKFTFLIEPIDSAPLPEGYDVQNGVTVSSAVDNRAEFTFGEDKDKDGDRGIEFTKPGVYEYVIYEKQPDANESMPGMSYSGARYALIITVEDNGRGALKATSQIQKLYMDDATPLFTYDAEQNRVMNAGEEAQDEILFTNTYRAKEVTKVPVAQKKYEDLSGEKPLTSDMFEFKFEPAGVVENGSLKAGTANLNPMPFDERGNRFNAVTVKNEGESIVFLPITFTEVCIPATQDTITYRYTMREVMPVAANASNQYKVNGMKYDSNVAIVDVVVTRSEDTDTLIVDMIYENDETGIVFHNTYTPLPVNVELLGEKTLVGRDMKENESFTFVMTGPDIQTKEIHVSGIKDGETKNISFGEYTFTKPGTFSIDIAEQPGNEGGVTYDTHTCQVTIVVTDVNGKLEADVTYSDGERASFKNTYEAIFDNTTAIRLSGTKKLTGRQIQEGEFFFVVTNASGEKTYVSAPKSEKGDLGTYESDLVFLEHEIYEEIGTYTYEIREVIPTDGQGNEVSNGVEHDRTRYIVEVTVVDDLNGNLKAAISKVVKKINDTTETVVYRADESGEAFEGELVFENKYTVSPTEYTVGTFKKVLKGNRKDGLKMNEFQFVRTIIQAEHADGIQLYKKNSSSEFVDGESSDIVGNDMDGTIQFGNIRFSKEGVYILEIKEVIPEDNQRVAGVTYDDHVIRETYTVTNDMKGNLVVTLTKVEGDTEFENVYHAEGVLSGESHLTVTKKVNLSKRTSDTWGTDENDTYIFMIEAADEKTTTAISDGNIIMGKNVIEINGEGAVATNEKGVYSNQKSFGDIEFKAAGEYRFKIYEKQGYAPGIQYDETIYVLAVSVVDNGDGTSQVVVCDENTTNFYFENRYSAGEITLKGSEHLRVNKVFTGRQNNEWLSTDEFTFTVEANENHTATKRALDAGYIIMPTEAEAQISITEETKNNAHFGDIVFKRAGTYQFIIKEMQGDIAGVQYDEDAERIIQVIVQQHEVGTQAYLTARIDYENSDVDEHSSITFKNTYQSKPSNRVSILAKKMVTPKIEGNQYTIKAGDFGFILLPASSNKASDPIAEMTVYNDEEGNVQFALEKEYVEPGEYQYVIKETAGKNGTIRGIIQDETIYVIQVSVSHDYANAKLKATMTVKKELDGQEETVSAIEFDNVYDPSVTSASISGIKKLNITGGSRVLKNGEFKFRLAAVDSAPMPDQAQDGVLEVTNVESTFSFGSIEYQIPGTYRYFVTEIADENKNYFTYDETEYEVVIKVEDVEGELVVIENSLNTTQLVFENSYNPAPAKVILSGMKHLTGRAIEAKEFLFLLKKDGEVFKTAQNEADGTFTFEELTFTEFGTYQYVVVEDSSNPVEGMTYDTAQIDIEIIVTDDEEGQLIAQVNGMDELSFNNTYDSTAVPTGDTTNLMPMVTGMIVSLCMFAVLGVERKKRNDKE